MIDKSQIGNKIVIIVDRWQQAHVRRAHVDAEGEDGQEGRSAGADAPREGGQAQGVYIIY